MKIIKYTARTEQEAIEKVREELGPNALVLNIKKTQPRGIFKLFKKPKVEITAAVEDKSQAEKPADVKHTEIENQKKELISVDKRTTEQQEKIKSLEKKLVNTEDLLEKVVSQLTLSELIIRSGALRKYENSMIQMFYEVMIEQGVTPEIAEKILYDVDALEESEKNNINLIIKIVYNTIIGILGEPDTVKFAKNDTGNPLVIVFMGPTGVGKTTTIAKLTSIFILNHNMRVGLITADTYRIAAVEQLRTYGDILGIDVNAVYNIEDMESVIQSSKYINDIVFVDTAGRSHKHENNLNELADLLSLTFDSERYLVLSVTTKYEDLINIINAYSRITNFKLIFTKLDETVCLGSILNICYLTGKKISYVTNGQNVPDDISVARPDKLAKALLGMGGEIF